MSISFCRVCSHLNCVSRFVLTQKTVLKDKRESESSPARREAVGSVPGVLTAVFASSISMAPDGTTGSEHLDLAPPEQQLNSLMCLLWLKIVLPRSIWLDKAISLEAQL